MKVIFLADDDADDRLFFEEALEEISLATELTFATDGVELMAALEEIVTEMPPPPHVIFLDINMPRKNGIECLKEIRENPRMKDIPVVIFSTTANENSIETTYSLGANCYICKPSSHQLLIKAIETVLALNLWEQNQQLSKEKFVVTIT
jgi:CheY-like chemotaxis protein